MHTQIGLQAVRVRAWVTIGAREELGLGLGHGSPLEQGNRGRGPKCCDGRGHDHPQLMDPGRLDMDPGWGLATYGSG